MIFKFWKISHMLPENIKNEILEALKPVNPYKIILFGSYARNDANINSDIDLYIVTGDDFIPGSFADKMSIKTEVTKALRMLKKKYDFDLIVHTRKMSEIFFQIGRAHV